MDDYHGNGMKVPPLSSHGFVAAVVLLAAASGQDTLRERINHALDEARPALLAHLKAATDGAGRPGELALVVLAGVHDGLDLKNAVFAQAVQRLAKSRPSETYDLALRLLVCEAFAAFPERAELAKKDAKDLLEHRHRSGPFGYGDTPGGWDLSNTQYGALGLRAARARGVRIERSVWQKLADEVGEQQDSYGGFNYGRVNSGSDAYASMTAAGIAVLAICRLELEADSKAPKAYEQRIERGWQWFARNLDTLGSKKERWSYYFHYGLERAAILCDVTAVGGVDWYEKGATMLVDEQLDGGGWRSTTDGYPGGHLASGRGDLVPTSFAVLFLRRKFQKVTGPITPHVVVLANIGPMSKAPDIEACAAGLVRRGKEAMPDVLRALRSELSTQRRAAAAALQGIAGESFGYDASKDAAANTEAVRKAELWYLKNRG